MKRGSTVVLYYHLTAVFVLGERAPNILRTVRKTSSTKERSETRVRFYSCSLPDHVSSSRFRLRDSLHLLPLDASCQICAAVRLRNRYHRIPGSTAIMPALQFWKPGTAAPGSTLDRESEAEGSLLSSAPATSLNLSLTSQRTRLPIYKHREKLLYCVEKYGCVIVVGQTGCGKSTREWLSGYKPWCRR